jgi:hypothetical protein
MTRQATKEDYKVGTILTDANEGYQWKINNHYDDGIWEARRYNGHNNDEKVMFEGEARFYTVEA